MLALLLAAVSCERDTRKASDLDKIGQVPAPPAATTPETASPGAPVIRDEKPTWRIPAGTEITVKTRATLSTRTANTGDKFQTTLAKPVSVDGSVALKEGTEVGGIVFATSDGRGVRRAIEMELRLNRVSLGPERFVDIRTVNLVLNPSEGGNQPVLIEPGSVLTFKLAAEARIPKE